RALLLRGAGSAEWFLPKIARLEDLLIRQHRRPLDGVLERPYVARPRLLAEPLERRFAQGHAPAEPAGKPGRKMPRQGCDVAAPFTATNGPAARGLARWIAWAMTSLPVPRSPVMSTVVGCPATRATSSRACRIAGLSAISARAAGPLSNCALSVAMVCPSRSRSSALRSVSTTSSGR